MNPIEIISLLGNLASNLGEFKDILLAVLSGNGADVLSTEGSLTGSSDVGDIGGAALGSALGSLGLDDLVGKIPTTPTAIISSLQ